MISTYVPPLIEQMTSRANIASTVTKQGKQLGHKQPLFPDYARPYPPEWAGDGDLITLRQLIDTIVRQEVAGFRERQEERRLFQVPSQQEIGEGANRGFDRRMRKTITM